MLSVYVKDYFNRKKGILISELLNDKIAIGWTFCNVNVDKYSNEILLKVNKSINNIVDGEKFITSIGASMLPDTNAYKYSVIQSLETILSSISHDLCIMELAFNFDKYLVNSQILNGNDGCVTKNTFDLHEIKTDIQNLGYLFSTPMQLAQVRLHNLDNGWVEDRDIIYQNTFLEIGENDSVEIISKLPKEYYGVIMNFIKRSLHYYKGKHLHDSLRTLTGILLEKWEGKYV